MDIPVLNEPEVIFHEPWQAEAFATTVHLSRSGLFTWPEWVEQFSTVIAREPATEGETTGAAYYRQWMSALEKMLARTVCLSDQVVTHRQALWHTAYLNTPHGQPVALSNAGDACGDAHEHYHHEDNDPAHHHHHAHSHSHDPHARRPTPRPAAVVPARR